MAARGKKRRRQDGSVATGKSTSKRIPDYHNDPIDAVSAAALSESLRLNLPGEYLDDVELEDLDAGQADMDAIADRHDVDTEALEIRTSKLIVFLRRRGDLAQATSAEQVTVDPDLIEYAANVPIKFGEDLIVGD